MRYATLIAILAFLIIVTGCGGQEQEAPTTEEAPVAEEASAAVTERHDLLYVCNCESDCDCGSVSAKPGTCSCGTELTGTHVVRIEGTEALLCPCSDTCECTVDPADATKCSCGETLRRVALTGTGVYHCGCGDTCDCHYVSDAPGVCTCGKDLVTAG